MTISVDKLKELLRYEPETGRLFWLPRGIEWFHDVPHRSASGICTTWNKRYANTEAFTSKGGAGGHKMGAVLGVHVTAHRVAWAIHYGIWPEGWIDHINGDPTDNRIANLRIVNAQGNARNCARSRRNKSGVTGVCWTPGMAKWHAQIYHAGANRHLGWFDDFAEAVRARADAEKQFGYHPNHGRAPKQMEV